MGAEEAARCDEAATWLRHPLRRAAIDALTAIDPADLDSATRVAGRLLADSGWVGTLIAPLAAALRTDPWFDPPLRIRRDASRTTAILVDTPAALIGASIVSADALAAGAEVPTVIAPGHVSVTRYQRAAGATLHRWRVPPVRSDGPAAAAAVAIALPPHDLTDGEVIVHDGRVEAHRLWGAGADMALVTAVLRGGRSPLARAFAAKDGASVRMAETDPAQARTAMLLTLLRVSGRTDAGAAFEAATHDPGFHLRWGAMREWLALDCAAALPRLRTMRADPHHQVAAAARRMLAVAEAAACRG